MNILTVHCPLSQTHRVSHLNHHFHHLLNFNLQEKVWVFLNFSMIFLIVVLFFIELLLRLGICAVSVIGWGYFVWVCLIHIVAIKNIMLVIHVFVYASHFGVVYHVYAVLCISCLSKNVTMTVTCDSVVVIDYIALSCACFFIIFAHHMHKCCTCYFIVNLVHVLWLRDISVFISMCTYFIN